MALGIDLVNRGTAAQWLLIVGALNALLTVMAGAYGAHAFAQQASPQNAATFATALQYHQFHSLGLLAIGILATMRPGHLWVWAGVAMFAGLVLFCGGLYITATIGYRMGMLTPIGGIAFMAAWALVAIAAWRYRPGSR